MLDERALAIQAEERLGWSPSTRLRIQSMIPAALANLSKEVAKDPTRRPLLQTDPDTVDEIIVEGSRASDLIVELSTVIADDGVMLDYIRNGTTYYTAPSTTFGAADLDLTTSGVVSGAGTTAVDGTYTQRGVGAQPHLYNLVGYQSDPGTKALSYESDDNEWHIWSNQIEYKAFFATPTSDPWDFDGSYTEFNGDSPPPSVTQSTNAGTFIAVDDHGFTTGDTVRLTTSSALPTGFSLLTTYYVIVYDADTFGLALSLADAEDGIAVVYTDVGTGVQTINLNEREIVQWLASPTQGSLTSCLPFSYPTAYLQGTTLQLLNVEIGGEIEFNVPYVPTSLTFPDDQYLYTDLLDTLVAVCVTQGIEDTPPDDN